MLLEAEVSKMLVSGDPWAAWSGFQLPVSDEYICIWAPIGTRKHWKPRHWKPDFFYADRHTLTYIWPDKWFAIHISYDKEGNFSSGYCDVTLPAPAYTSQTREIIYTDLYVDVVIREDYSVYTKDQEVYERAALQYPIVAEAREKSYEVLDWMEEHAKKWTGPFQVMPRRLPYTNWDDLSEAEIRESMRQSAQEVQ
jgi:protein associated with RNAse G/E